MSDYPDFPPNDYDDMGDESPYIDWTGWSDEPPDFDTYGERAEYILGSFGLEGIERIVLDISDANPEDLRGNRFANIEEAILYLFDSGILGFSNVYLDGDEIVVGIERCSNPPCD